MLSDITIRDLIRSGRILIDPRPADRAYQPASVDLRLGRSFAWIRDTGVIDTFDDEDEDPGNQGAYVKFDPGDCVLGCTVEYVRLPDDIAGRVEGKSTWGRRFLQVHSTAGFIDPGFEGQITLELRNLSPVPVIVPIGGFIAQISFQRLDRPAQRPYGHPELNSHYQHQLGATLPRGN